MEFFREHMFTASFAEQDRIDALLIFCNLTGDIL